jgi:hypothetical protein
MPDLAVLLATVDVAKLFFDSASDLAKQLISVSTVILGLSITFLKDLTKGTQTAHFWPLRASWIIYLFSIICGFWTLMAITGSIESLLKNNNSPAIVDNIRIPAGLQIILFVCATVFLVVYGIVAIGELQRKPEPPQPKEITVE